MQSEKFSIELFSHSRGGCNYTHFRESVKSVFARIPRQLVFRALDRATASAGEGSMQKLRTVVFGTGFMGRVHTEAIRRLGNVDVVGISGSSMEKAQRFAREHCIEHAESDFRRLLDLAGIDVVHICTPNSLHFEMARLAIEAGKHVICEKPLASTTSEARELVALVDHSPVANCTLYNVRSYAQVQNMRRMCEAGELGEILAIQGTYSQDWLLLDSDWNWRIEEGASRTFADIGTHWCDLAEHVTGKRITAVCADLQTFHTTRKKPRKSIETFAGKRLRPTDYEQVEIRTEDFGAMLFRMGSTTRGSMTVSQVAGGRKNRLFLEIYGSEAAVAWNAESPDMLWVGHRNSPNELVIKDPTLLKGDAHTYADLPGGHSEGYDDTFKQSFRRFYRRVSDPAAPIEYPTFVDGLRQLQLLDAVLASSKQSAWVGLSSNSE